MREYSLLCKSMLCILFFFSRLSERRGRKGGRGSWVRRGHHQGMELSVEISSILSFSILSHKMYSFFILNIFLSTQYVIVPSKRRLLTSAQDIFDTV